MEMRPKGPQAPHRQGDLVLLKAVVGSREGWGVMTLEDFLEKLDLEVWRDNETVIGTILPQTRQRMS
jgi:hypothetical protein